MLKKVDMAPSGYGPEEIEYYRSLARLSERRTRDIRRIAALEREQLERRSAIVTEAPLEDARAAENKRLRLLCRRLQKDLSTNKAEMKKLKRAHARIMQSRTHRVAEAYIRLTQESALFALILRPIRFVLHVALRARRWVSRSHPQRSAP